MNAKGKKRCIDHANTGLQDLPDIEIDIFAVRVFLTSCLVHKVEEVPNLIREIELDFLDVLEFKAYHPQITEDLSRISGVGRRLC